MRYFKLPDLGEGLMDADIVEWHVKSGDTVSVDQLLLSVETAKAIVDVPSPCAGVIAHLYGEAGDTVNIGEPLVEFESADSATGDNQLKESADQGTVVGNIPLANEVSEDHFTIATRAEQGSVKLRATPSVRALAKRLGVDIEQVVASGADGRVTSSDVEKAGLLNQQKGNSERLTGVRKSMANNMALAHEQVVPVTLFDEADVSQWKEDEDTTIRLIQAIAFACEKEPQLNAWFNGEQLTLRKIEQVDLGIAVDTEHGLFVPVLRDVARRDGDDLRRGLNQLKADVNNRKIPPRELQGATFTLSNYGALAGRYGTPVVIPPTVAILGCGRLVEQPMSHMGELYSGRVLPLSLTFDHRVVTGGEAARFMASVIQSLQM